MARQKVVYILSYCATEGRAVLHHRIAAFSTFARAYNAMAEEVDYWYSQGGHLLIERYNDPDIARATHAYIEMLLPDGSFCPIYITPSYVN